MNEDVMRVIDEMSVCRNMQSVLEKLEVCGVDVGGVMWVWGVV